MESTSDLIPLQLRDQWLSDVAALGCTNTSHSTNVLNGILARYAEPHRRYHSVNHVVHVLKAADDLLAAEGVDLQSEMGRTVRLALWYHDAIYDVRSGSNEQDSAVLAESELALLKLSVHVRMAIARLIMITKYPAIPTSHDEAIVHDADLVILRAPREVYRRYVDQVRAEYSFVSDDDWVVGRRRVMEGFLNAEYIFHTKTATAEEHIARANITSELNS
jgi:predicted metal-dependent HD superfamily phosphohydrolase